MVGRKTTIILLLVGFSVGLLAQKKIEQVSEVPANFCISEMEWKLYRMISQYRHQYDLPPIPLSKSLCYVANTHVKDLFFHHPDVEPCNFHSWSDKGPWEPSCYPGDEAEETTVWNKPAELTGYPGKGFEIVYWENNAVVIDSVIAFWKSFDYFNGFLMNTGKWEGNEWKAIGIGICQNYAATWFGEIPDTSGVPYVCGQEPPKPKPKPDTVSALKTEKPVPPPISGTYYIIVKSQLPKKASEKLARQLIEKGYPKASVLTHDNKVRVSIFHTTNRERALQMLRETKVTYRDAWLYKH
ncbi:MAG: hypothetical protein ISR57_03260 [Bacteroidales bacterium]|nr:hypothetical protein [Bacteroidales bacterium]